MDATRRELRARRRAVDAGTQQRASAAVAARAAPILEGARTLGAYAAVNGEIDPHPLIDAAWRRDVVVYLPRVTAGRSMVFGQWRPAPWGRTGAFGVPEPPLEAPIRAAGRLDAVLVPLVAFDRTGTRLGTGAGFYDRAFAFRLSQARGTRPLLVGLAYGWQEVPHLERRSWDVPLDVVVTDAEVIRPHLGAGRSTGGAAQPDR
jgi:5-formyltetrahydrofolate cyclo-ligase